MVSAYFTYFLCRDCKQYLMSASAHLFLLYQMHCVDPMTSLIFPFGLFAVFGILYVDSLPFEPFHFFLPKKHAFFTIFNLFFENFIHACMQYIF